MKVVLRNPRREIDLPGGRRVKDILRELQILPETVLVIRGDTMVTADQVVRDDETIELRPVMSGGSASRRTSAELQAQPVRGETTNDRASRGRRGGQGRRRPRRGYDQSREPQDPA
jgi:sulfur carrier protein